MKQLWMNWAAALLIASFFFLVGRAFFEPQVIKEAYTPVECREALGAANGFIGIMQEAFGLTFQLLASTSDEQADAVVEEMDRMTPDILKRRNQWEDRASACERTGVDVVQGQGSQV